MHFIPLAACLFLLFCSPGHKHRHHPVRHVSAMEQAWVKEAPARRIDGNGPCDKVLGKNWDSWGNQDDFVGQFLPSQQHHVLVCIDRLAKKRGLK